MFLFSTAFFVLSFLVPSVAGFGVGQPLQQHHSRKTASTTTLNATPLEISDALNSLSIATIDADIANIQLEEFRLVFAGGLAVMFGGLISTTLLGTIIEKKDLYANLAAESYIDMADDPNFWQQMTEGMSPEEKEKAKELMAKIKAQRAGETAGTEQLTTMSSEGAETSGGNSSSSSESQSSSLSPSSVTLETAKDEAAKASNDMFSDY